MQVIQKLVGYIFPRATYVGTYTGAGALTVQVAFEIPEIELARASMKGPDGVINLLSDYMGIHTAPARVEALKRAPNFSQRARHPRWHR